MNGPFAPAPTISAPRVPGSLSPRGDAWHTSRPVTKMLSGNLDTFSLADLLQWLEMNALTGRVTIARSGVRRSIDLKHGAIVFVSSTRPDERLGVFLARRGVLPEKTVYALLAENFATGRNLTRLILDGGLLTREQLAEVVESLAIQVLLDLFHWRDAIFEFDPDVKTEDILRIQLSLRGQALAIHGAKSVDDEARIDLGEPPHATDDDRGWEQDFSPEALAGTFWELAERTPGEGDGGETIRRRWYLFGQFADELKRRLAAPFRLMPVYDDTVALARTVLDREDPSEDVVRLAGLDPFLTADILYLANALRTKPSPLVSSAGEAASAVGKRALYLLVSYLVGPEVARTRSADRLERLIRRSALSTAVAASHLAPHLGLDPEDAYTLGLLESLSGYEPLKILLGMEFLPGPFRAGVLDSFRPLYGRTLARKLNLPQEHVELFGSTGEVTSRSSRTEQLIFFSRLQTPAERIGRNFSSEDPELADRYASIAHGSEVVPEIERDIARLLESLGL